MKRLVPRRFKAIRDVLDNHGAFLSFLLIIIMTFVGLYYVRSLAQSNASAVKLALQALCNQRHSYEHTIKTSREFLKEHPNGIPGISRKLILKSIHDANLRRSSLAKINCPPEIPGV